MAKMTYKAGDEWALKLSQLGERAGAVAKKAIYPAAGLLADRIKANIQALPEEGFHFLQDGETFAGVPQTHKKALLDGLGISPIDMDRDMDWSAKVGFDGYASDTTKSDKYPNGLPLPMLARSIERGSSVRKATPFVKPAVKAAKKEAIEAMQQVIDEETEKIMKGK